MKEIVVCLTAQAFLFLFATSALSQDGGARCVSSDLNETSSISFSTMELALINNPYVWELAEIGDELVRAVINGNKEAYADALAAGKLDEAAVALGLTRAQIADYDRRLESARSNLITTLPSLTESMPRRSLSDDPLILARQIRSLVENENKLSSVSFLEILEERRHRLEALPDIKSDPQGGSLSFLVPPPDFGPGPNPGPCVSPPCDPGQPPEDPPDEEEELPPEVDPHADCAYVPYTASLVACSFTGVAGYIPCAILAMCTWCEGGWINTTCTP